MALKGLTALFGGSGAPIEFSNKNYKKNNKLYTIVTYLIAIVIVGLMMVFGRDVRQLVSGYDKESGVYAA